MIHLFVLVFSSFVVSRKHFTILAFNFYSVRDKEHWLLYSTVQFSLHWLLLLLLLLYSFVDEQMNSTTFLSSLTTLRKTFVTLILSNSDEWHEWIYFVFTHFAYAEFTSPSNYVLIPDLLLIFLRIRVNFTWILSLNIHQLFTFLFHCIASFPFHSLLVRTFFSLLTYREKHTLIYFTSIIIVCLFSRVTSLQIG